MNAFIAWWKNLSVAKKLYSVVGLMGVLVLTELFTLLFAMNILSAVRAFVGGEGLWSKAQKNALFEIQKYIYSHDEADYRAFRENLKVNFGGYKARLELVKPVVDFKKATQGFIEGKNHPSDIPSMIRLVRKFNRISYIHQSLELWTSADLILEELDVLGKKIHEAIYVQKLPIGSPKMKKFIHSLSDINNRLTLLEDHFSYTLGEASRWLESRLMIFLLVLVFIVEGTGLFLAVNFTKRLGRVLSELNEAAAEIGSGNFNKELQAHSKDELGQLALAINKMTFNLRVVQKQRQEATEASDTKSLFLANISHEIRTPLAAMLGFVELLRDTTLSEVERLKFLDIVKRTGESLATVINDILDISKVEAGKLEINHGWCHLGGLLKDIQLLLRPRCEGKGIHLKFVANGKIPDTIFIDEARLKQILINIIGNAIKFTNKGGVDVFYMEKNGFLEFMVYDTGIGISPDETQKLFQNFSQVDLSVRKSHGGTGLGLILSRRLAQLLGGDVSLVRTEKGMGSIFSVRVKLGAISTEFVEEKKEVPSQKSLSLRGRKILVVEDNPDNQLLIKQILSKNGAAVAVSSNGLDGMNEAQKNHYDIVLMDMQMPVMDGYSATLELRNHNYAGPIIGLTAHAMSEDIRKSINAGCNAVLTKPFQSADLLNIVFNHCHADDGAFLKELSPIS